MNEKHCKFAKYWESIGKPQLEVWLTDNWHIAVPAPSLYGSDYRIRDDPHWELRRKWIDSDFTLPIEFRYSASDGNWCRTVNPDWVKEIFYREAVPKPVYSKEYKAGYDHGFKDATDKLETLLEQMYAVRSKDG